MKGVKLTISTIVFVSFAIASIAAQRPRAYSKEKPIRTDFDMENVDKPKSQPMGYLYDLVDGTVFRPIRNSLNIKRTIRRITGKKNKEAVNVNVLDQVPNSSWFTKRMGFRSMPLEELLRGPNRGNGPNTEKKLTVIKGKTIGTSSGFWIKDGLGDIYILKFDSPKFPELASGAEMIGTKMFYAFGYNVPENYLFRFRREDLVIGKKAKFRNDENRKAKMREKDLDLILSRVARQKDGRYRALASKLIKGKPIGGFSFSGKRKDDSNDIIPHEIRRDIRALKVFGAWTEHNDLRAGNTLDFFVEEDGRKFVKHYLIDFGSTFGSDTGRANLPEVGREYGFDFEQARKILLTAGIYQPPWRSKKYDPVFSPPIGRYSTKSFRPNKWRSNFALTALSEMTSSDGFWAMQIVAAFSPKQIRAIVETAEFSDPKDTEYLTNQIIARQRAIVRYYSRKRTGIGMFSVQNHEKGANLSFKDYRLLYPSEKAFEIGYEYKIQTLDKRPKTLSKGFLRHPELEFDNNLVKAIAEIGNSPKNKGVAKLIFRRPNEKQSASIFLWSREGRGLQIVGIYH